VKVGDMVKYKSEYTLVASIGVILSVGCPDIWVLTNLGNKEWWNEQCVEVISESR